MNVMRHIGAAGNWMFKVGTVNAEEIPFIYQRQFVPQSTTGQMRLVVSTDYDYVTLLRSLAQLMPEPYQMLYVLRVSRCDQEPGRYQLSKALTSSELESFFAEYGSFLEHDARHNIWLRSALSGSQLVYDHHNLIYAYGDLSAFELSLSDRGFTKAATLPLLGSHIHNYHRDLDGFERQILANNEWIFSPLREND